MAVSEFFDDDEIISQLRMFFDIEEQDQIDFNELLGQLESIDDDTLQLKVNGRVFNIDKVFCNVTEVELE